MSATPPRILFLVADDWYFVSHRLEFGRRLLQAGYTVAVGCRGSGLEAAIRAADIQVFPVPFERGSLSLPRALREAGAVRRLLKSYRPDIVHQVALRTILVSSLAGLGLRGIARVNAIAGLGSLFTGNLDSSRLRAAHRLVAVCLRWALRRRSTGNVFQNREDLESFVRRGFTRRQDAFLIRGAGIDPKSWSAVPEPENAVPVVFYVGRLLKDKGVGELVEASRTLKARGCAHRLRLVGWTDPCNPTTFTEQEVRSWHEHGDVEWLGKRDDVLEQMSQANVVVVPSYREGLPKVLLEAGLAARAVVACDVPGSREVVTHGVSGLLVPPRNSAALADAIARLLGDRPQRAALAKAHQALVAREFSLDQVASEFLKLYQLLLAQPRRPAAKP